MSDTVKIVIEIPKYDLSKVQNGSIASKMILNAVQNGTPCANVISIDQANAMIKSYVSHYEENKCFDGMTNGEVIKALFPIERIYKEEYVEVVFKRQYHTTYFTLDFWNAPFDDVKEEIADKAIKDANGEGFIFLGRLLRIFDNIGKIESEDK